MAYFPVGNEQSHTPFDLDMMKRAMEPSAYETSKKPRYNNHQPQTSPPSTTSSIGPVKPNAFENYGYGPQSALYTTPTPNAMTTTTSGSTAAPPSPYVMGGGMGGYGGMMPMVGMNNGVGMMGMNNGVGMMNNGMMGMNGMGMNGMFNMGGVGMGMGVGGGFGYANSPTPQMGQFQHQQAQQQPQASPMGMGVNPGMGMMPNFGVGMGVVGGGVGVGMGIQGHGHYSPAVAAAAAAAANNATGRTVYIGSLPPSASVDELLNLVHFGPLESIRVLPSKSCVFLSFLDGATAAAFHADATIRKMSLHGQELKIGWGKASPVPSAVMMAITQSSASRNVYLGGLDAEMTEEQLRDDLSRFGLIDQVKIVRDKNIGFVHFLSIGVASKVVATLPTEAGWAGKRVNYGKDRCAYVPRGLQAGAVMAQVAAAQSLVAHGAMGGVVGGGGGGDGANVGVMNAANAGTGMNRTIYMGNIHPDTSLEDLCNAIRGGVLQSIKYLPEKHIAFITFIDPSSALSFFQHTSYHGLTINQRRVKVGWGKNPGVLGGALAMSVHGGATRNVYVGNIGEGVWELFGEERLRRDFGEWGEIELINYLKEKNCAFVNFTNILNAIRAIEGIKANPAYAGLRISHGKDRCANPPRIPSASGSSMRRRNGSPSGSTATGGVKEEVEETKKVSTEEEAEVVEGLGAIPEGEEGKWADEEELEFPQPPEGLDDLSVVKGEEGEDLPIDVGEGDLGLEEDLGLHEHGLGHEDGKTEA